MTLPIKIIHDQPTSAFGVDVHRVYKPDLNKHNVQPENLGTLYPGDAPLAVYITSSADLIVSEFLVSERPRLPKTESEK